MKVRHMILAAALVAAPAACNRGDDTGQAVDTIPAATPAPAAPAVPVDTMRDTLRDTLSDTTRRRDTIPR